MDFIRCVAVATEPEAISVIKPDYIGAGGANRRYSVPGWTLSCIARALDMSQRPVTHAPPRCWAVLAARLKVVLLQLPYPSAGKTADYL